MLITKPIELGLNIQDPVGICVSKEDNIRNILQDRIVGTCIRGCFILSINQIIRMSNCDINQDGNPSFSTISVIAEITGIVYSVGEIINGCVVNNKDNKGIIICSTEHASIMLNADESLESIQKGQKISVRVGGVKYIIGSKSISINAVPFSFSKKPTVFAITAVTPDIKQYVEGIVARIRAEEEVAAGIKRDNPAGWRTFTQLLYAYREEQKTPTGARVVNLLDLDFASPTASPDKAPLKYISRDPRLDLTAPNAYVYTDARQVPEGSIIRDESIAKNVMLFLLEDYYNYLKMINEMISIYNTEELLASHKNLWLIFKKAKLPTST